MQITSTVFVHTGEIPNRYTCQGRDASPPRVWSDFPSGVKNRVLIVDEPERPDPAAPRMTWVHGLLYKRRS